MNIVPLHTVDAGAEVDGSVDSPEDPRRGEERS